MLLKNISKGIFNLVFPKFCVFCHISLYKNEKHLCLNCYKKLPWIESHEINDLEMKRVFWGRVNLVHIHALFYFEKSGTIQKIIHEIKYKSNQDLATFLGEELGKFLMLNNGNAFDYIIPMPTHYMRRLKRGFNQCELIADGAGHILKVPVKKHLIERITYEYSQTSKNKEERWNNVKDAFKTNMDKELDFKHVLFIDDVMTTGATLEACVQNFQETYPHCKVSIAVIAFTKLT